MHLLVVILVFPQVGGLAEQTPSYCIPHMAYVLTKHVIVAALFYSWGQFDCSLYANADTQAPFSRAFSNSLSQIRTMASVSSSQ